MELKQHLIHRKYHKCEAKNQITIGEDFSVPEGRSDVGGILQKRGELRVEEVHAEKGKMRIRGMLHVWVLYLTERAAKPMDHLELEIPFDEVLYMDGAESGDQLKLDWSMEQFQVTIIHPGKLSVRALVNLYALVIGTEEHLITEGAVGEEAVYTKTEPYTYAEPVMERNDSYRIREEVTLPANKPNVENVLWQDLQLRSLDMRILEGKLGIKGELLLFAVYEGEGDSASVQWLEQTVPFHGTLEIPELTGEMVGVLEHEIDHWQMDVKPDYDGELRTFQLEMLLNIHMQIWEERSGQCLKDAYSTKEELTLSTQELTYERFRMCNQAKCRVKGQETVDPNLRILQILGQQARIQNRSAKMTEQGILCEGFLEVQILFVTANDRQPFGSALITVPYQQLVEISGIAPGDRWKISETIDQILITMPDGGTIELSGTIDLSVCVMEPCRMENVTEIAAAPYDQEKGQKLPGMTIHFVQPKESLWEIAKAYRTTAEEIKKQNDLSADEIFSGQKLLLLKSSPEQILG